MNKIDRDEIANLLVTSNVDSGSSDSKFNDDIEWWWLIWPQLGWLWRRRKSWSKYFFRYWSVYGITGNNWTENFNEPHINAHITFNPHNLSVGINLDLIDTLSLASPYVFSLFLDDEIINLFEVETNKYAKDKLSKPV